MKQRLFAFSLMCLLCVGAWAQERMTVQVLDHYDGPMAGLKVQMTDNNTGDHLGEFTTNAEGKFVMDRKDHSPLILQVVDLWDSSVQVDWYGGAEPVVVRLENHVMFTIRWTDRTPELESMAYFVLNGRQVYGWDENNMVSRAVRFDEYGESPVWWTWDGVVMDRRHMLYDVSQPQRRKLTVTLGLDRYARLTVTARGLQGEELNASARLQGNGLEGSTGNIRYVPAGTYRMSIEAYAMDESADPTRYIPTPAQQLNLAAGEQKTVSADYQQDGHDVSLSVYDVDARPLREANVDVRLDEGTSVNAQTDAQGEVHLVAFPGTYTLQVNRCYELDDCSGAYFAEEQLTVADADVLAEVRMADYYARLKFDVTRPPFMTDPHELQVRAAGENLRYDEASGLYTGIVRRPQEDYQREWYVDSERMFPVRGELGDLAQTVKVDLSGYKARVKLVSADPAKYRIEEAEILKQISDGYNHSHIYPTYDPSYEGMYMAPGEYSVKVTLTDIATGQRYPLPEPIAFTVGDTHMEVPCTLNEDDFNELTVALSGFGGQPLSGEWVRVYSYGDGPSISQSGTTDGAGRVVLTLPDGDYNVSVFTESDSEYPQRDERVTLDGDRQLTISCEGYRPLNVTVHGDLLPDFHGGEYDGRRAVYISKKNDNYGRSMQSYLQWNDNASALHSDRTLYLPEGDYVYSLQLELEPYILRTTGDFKLTGDQGLDITVSADTYRRTTLRVQDESGALLRDGYVEVMPAGSDRSEWGSVNPQTVFYLPDGAYRAVYRDHNSTLVSAADFTVAGADQTVVITHRRTEMYDLTVRARVPETGKEYIYNGLYIDFYMNGMRVEGVNLNLDPASGDYVAETRLSAGTYTYEMEDYGLLETGEVTVEHDGQELSLDFTAKPYIILRMTDETTGQPVDPDLMTAGLVSRGGYFYDMWEYDYFGMLSPATYDVWAWAYGYRVAQGSVTVDEGGQTVTMSMQPADPDRFTVVFGYDDRYIEHFDHDRDMKGTIALGDFGTYPMGYMNVFADIPAGTYPYTLQVEGFAPCTGTVEVSEANQWVEEDTPPHIIVVELMADDKPTGVDSPTAESDGAFRVFPTVADDLLHIAPATTTGGAWTVRVVSASGAVMYTAPCDSATETVVPVATLPEGLYLLHLSNGTATETHKFVKR